MQTRIGLDRTFFRRVVLLALPIAIQTLLQSMLGMADVLMVGVLGDTAIAAVGLAAKIHFLLFVSMIGLSASSAILVAQYYGADKTQEYQKVIAKALVVGSWVMLPLSVLCFFTAHIWMAWITPDPKVGLLAAQYMKITAPILIVTQIISIYENGLRSLGNTTFPLIAAGIAVTLNVCLNYLLIFGALGFPELGVEGAAWGTLISRCLQFAIMVGWIYRTKHQFAIPLVQLKAVCRWSQVRVFVVFALPIIGNHMFWAIGNTVYHVLTGFTGTDALAVMGIIVPIELCFLSVFLGIAHASSVMIGQSLGADRFDYAWEIFRFFERLAIGLGLSMSLALWLSREHVVAMYSNLNADTLQLLADVLTIFCIGICLKVLNLLRIAGVLRAGGDNRFCFLLDVSVMWLIGLPLFVAAVSFGNVSFVVIYSLMFLEEVIKFLPARIRIGGKKWLVNLTHKHMESN